MTYLFSPSRWKSVTRKADEDYLGGTYYVLHVIPEEGPGVDALIDMKSFLPIAVRARFRGKEFIVSYRDYTNGPGGEAYPRHIAIIGPDGTTIKVDTITSLDDNVPIDDGAFLPPDK